MKRTLLLVSLAVLPSLAAAQPFHFGIVGGGADSLEDGFDLDFDDQTFEVFAGARIDVGTMFNIRVGRTDLEVGPDGSPVSEGRIEYVAGQVEYQFDEIWGSSSFFGGPGLYRARAGALEETNFGLSGGVSATFPLTRRFGFLLELAYHWVNLDEKYTFLTVAGGLKIAF
ncbi:MAG TPA: outer membrane beta-barrel protein [Thermoanaerobaculia bacterium]|nr:outer membrane beta-barrel protein [Thermoanaerobaculia bacterium]